MGEGTDENIGWGQTVLWGWHPVLLFLVLQGIRSTHCHVEIVNSDSRVGGVDSRMWLNHFIPARARDSTAGIVPTAHYRQETYSGPCRPEQSLVIEVLLRGTGTRPQRGGMPSPCPTRGSITVEFQGPKAALCSAM